jgi:hypothetical protein
VGGGKYKSNDMCDNMSAKGHGYLVMKAVQMDHLYGLQLEIPVKHPALLFHQFFLYE